MKKVGNHPDHGQRRLSKNTNARYHLLPQQSIGPVPHRGDIAGPPGGYFSRSWIPLRQRDLVKRDFVNQLCSSGVVLFLREKEYPERFRQKDGGSRKAVVDSYNANSPPVPLPFKGRGSERESSVNNPACPPISMTVWSRNSVQSDNRLCRSHFITIIFRHSTYCPACSR
jgi:hypothetical protein